MIVVDANVVAYLLLEGPHTSAAERVLIRDPAWAAPLLWRSELRNVLALHVRHRALPLVTAVELARRAEAIFRGREFAVSTARVLEVAERTGLSAVDSEYVTLAEDLDVRLLTTDGEILSRCPKRAEMARWVHSFRTISNKI